jgi:hypothetical protein
VFFHTYLIDSYLLATNAHNSQLGLGTATMSRKHSVVLLPLVAYGTDGSLGQGLALLINQLDNQQFAAFHTVFFLQGRQIAQAY